VHASRGTRGGGRLSLCQVTWQKNNVSKEDQGGKDRGEDRTEFGAKGRRTFRSVNTGFKRAKTTED